MLLKRVLKKKLYRAGANKVVKPFALGGIHMAHLITQPSVIEFLEILTGITQRDLKLEEINFNQLKEKYQNKTIIAIRQTGNSLPLATSYNLFLWLSAKS